MSRPEVNRSCYAFYQQTNDAIILEGSFSLSVDDLMGELDIYIVYKEFNRLFLWYNYK
ncbi:DUF4275 family protein [Clostridium folliculivorans]|uniref:DUF4275 family protein n=1 Tax=Clostridium folliculivorans TaxID=2886038 RepID=UPI003CFBD779